MQVERIRVLLVEDDPSQMALVEAILQREKGVVFEVKTADLLSAAFKPLREEQIDIVLLDLSLPDSHGIDTFLKVREVTCHTPVIVLTGNDDEELALEILRRGAQDYLFKGTVDGPLLVRAIRYSIYRILSERNLEEQRTRHRLLMEGIPDVRIYFKDAGGHFLEVNHAMANFHGFNDPREVVGLTDYDLFSRAHADEAARDERQIVNSGQPLVGKMEKETDQEGKVTWALTTKMPLQDGTGRNAGIVGISRDITDLKTTEERLWSALEEVTKSHEELSETQLLLIQAEKLRSLGQMAASVAHEVKNPLAILKMGIECLGEHCFQENEQISGLVGEMKGAVHRAEGIIRDMLDYSAAHELELREVCVNSLIERTLTFVRHELAKGRVRVVTDLPEGLSSCRLDAPKIEQVFINVFTNACHAMPDGGELTIATSEKLVESDDPEMEGDNGHPVRFRRGDKVVAVTIRDTGTGIPEDKLPKIFDPFFTTKDLGEGSGLGLAVVKKIIDLHQGKISIVNAEGGGVLVTVELKCFSGS